MPTPFRTGSGSLPRTLNVESVNATGASLLGPDTTAALEVDESGVVTVKGSNNTFICEGDSTFKDSSFYGELEVLGGPVSVSGTTTLNGNVKMGNVVESGNGHAINSGLEVDANGAVTVRGSSNTLLCENNLNVTGTSLLGPNTTAALEVDEYGVVRVKGSNNSFYCEGNLIAFTNLNVGGLNGTHASFSSSGNNLNGTTKLDPAGTGSVQYNNVAASIEDNGEWKLGPLERFTQGTLPTSYNIKTGPVLTQLNTPNAAGIVDLSINSVNVLAVSNPSVPQVAVTGNHTVTGDSELNTAGTGTVTLNNRIITQQTGTNWVMGFSSYLGNLSNKYNIKLNSNGGVGINSATESRSITCFVNRSEVLKISRIGNPATGEVDVTGNITMTGGSTAATHISTSDDRLKFNESPIQNALATIRKLSPQTYDKAQAIPEDGLQPEYTSREAGLIAQEVLQIPEMAEFVKPDGVVPVEVPATDAENATIDEALKALTAQKAIESAVRAEEEPDEERIAAEAAVTAQLEARLAEAEAAAVHPDTSKIKPFSLDYTSIFTHMIAAIQELDAQVQTQAVEIEMLKNK